MEIIMYTTETGLDYWETIRMEAIAHRHKIKLVSLGQGQYQFVSPYRGAPRDEITEIAIIAEVERGAVLVTPEKYAQQNQIQNQSVLARIKNGQLPATPHGRTYLVDSRLTWPKSEHYNNARRRWKRKGLI